MTTSQSVVDLFLKTAPKLINRRCEKVIFFAGNVFGEASYRWSLKN